MRCFFPWGISRKHLKHKNAHGDCDAVKAKAAAVVTHVQSLSREVGSGDEGLGLFGFDLSSAETDFWWLGEELRRRNRNQYMASTWLGTWLQKKLENLSAAVKKGKRGACKQKAATVLPNRIAATWYIYSSLSSFEFDIV